MKPSTSPRTRVEHPTETTSVRLFGRRVMLRPLIASDFAAFGEVRTRNGRWLTDWEPLRPMASADPAVRASCIEFVLAGLYATERISRLQTHGRTIYDTGGFR